MQPFEPQFQPLAGFSLTPEAGAQTFQAPLQAPMQAHPFQKTMAGQTAQQPAPAQAAPVAPVACPTYTPPGGHQAQPQAQQHPATRHLLGVARALEQSIPGYQVLVSVFQEMMASPRGQALHGAQTAADLIKDSLYHQYAALGAIRRFLCGEATAEVMLSLALNINQLMTLHTQLRPLAERMAMGAAPDLRPALTGLSQLLAPGGVLLTQATAMTQQLVGPRLWEAAVAQACSAQAAIPAGAAAGEASR